MLLHTSVCLIYAKMAANVCKMVKCQKRLPPFSGYVYHSVGSDIDTIFEFDTMRCGNRPDRVFVLYPQTISTDLEEVLTVQYGMAPSLPSINVQRVDKNIGGSNRL